MASDQHESGQELIEDDLDKLIDCMGQMAPLEGQENKTFEQKLEELENHPAFMKDVDPSKPLTAEMEGLMRLKYESEDPTGRAEAYKDDGNHEFQKKQYRIAVDNYTEGIKCLCPDKTLNAVLYCNRAAANFYLENFRSAFNDCVFARKFKPDHIKAIHKGAQCLLEVKNYDECMKWCDEALGIDSKNAKMLEIRQKATKVQKAIERDQRKEKQGENTVIRNKLNLVKAIQSRGIKLADLKQPGVSKKLNPTLLDSLEVHNPAGAQVYMDSNHVMYWPVMFLYPEHTDTDYIRVFSENHRLIDHLEHIFGFESEIPPWDADRRYRPHTINVYFEDREKETLHKVNKESTLLKILQHDRYRVYGGTPSFILTVAGSTFEKSFLARYGSL